MYRFDVNRKNMVVKVSRSQKVFLSLILNPVCFHELNEWRISFIGNDEEKVHLKKLENVGERLHLSKGDLLVSDRINCGVYVFTPTSFAAIQGVSTHKKDRAILYVNLALRPYS
ncbi:hypothetical protein LXL04_001368 [Taraxacum kok-saghyz]